MNIGFSSPSTPFAGLGSVSPLLNMVIPELCVPEFHAERNRQSEFDVW